MGYPILKAWLSTAVLVLAFSVGAPGAVLGEIDCTCRYGGQRYDQNACVCLMTSNGPRLACCGKVLNNSSWKFTGDMCPTASMPASAPAAAPAWTPAARVKSPANQGYASLSTAATR